MPKKIKIDLVNPNNSTSDGPDLLNYYFEENGDGYDFYAPTTQQATKLNTTLINPSVLSSCTVHFQVPAGLPGAGLWFYVTVTQFPAVLTMSGTWSDSTQPQETKDLPGSGTFQAQAGGTGPMEKEAAAATAK
jgi:hypothetical protein